GQFVPDYLASDEATGWYATCLEWPNLDHRPEPTRRARRAVEIVRVALVQYPMRPIKSFEEFATQCEFFVYVAGDARSDFVLFPELFTLQLLSIVKAVGPGQAARALAGFTPEFLELFAELAVKYDVNVIGVSQFVMEPDGLHNIAFLFRRDGTIAKQYKLHVTP